MLNLMILQHCKLLHDKVSLVDNSVLFAWETWGWNGQEEKRGWSVCSNSFTHEGQWRARNGSSSIFELPLWHPWFCSNSILHV